VAGSEVCILSKCSHAGYTLAAKTFRDNWQWTYSCLTI